MKRLMTWDILRLFQTANKIEALEQCQIATYKSNVILVEGASRSGKTNKAKYGDLILTVAQCTKEETAERVKRLRHFMFR